MLGVGLDLLGQKSASGVGGVGPLVANVNFSASDTQNQIANSLGRLVIVRPQTPFALTSPKPVRRQWPGWSSACTTPSREDGRRSGGWHSR